MNRIYVSAAYLIIAVVAAEFVLTVVVFLNRIRAGTVGVEVSMPDDGAGLGHQMLGLYIMPVVVLAMLISSFDTRFKGATRWAAGVGVLFIVDIALASFGVLYGTGFAVLHALTAVAMAVVALHAVRRLRTAPPDEKWDIDDFR